ncbi:hypothetical protein BDV95DRAFT_602984 [Massariosphaeria phaeospora]|uniref:Fungal N-terminal domain-containing protein n=1 Tax=Massariosphaeria phaeospora TaxID=100035 RepID=A0A7C8IL84_9PLEO|nr:hypothetical protein BDV95DRAFT_602984 [Massariosphaeria phaeospora]
MDPLGTVLGIAHVIKRGYDLYKGCQSATDEVQAAAEHVHSMVILLEGVRSDLFENPRSFVHTKTDPARARTQNLKHHIKMCEQSILRMEKLLNKYQTFRKGNVSAWNAFRWQEGKKEIAECKLDLVLSTVALDVFLSKNGLNVLWKLEDMMEQMLKKMAPFELFQADVARNGERRPRLESNVTRTIVASLVLARLMRTLEQYRRKKSGKTGASPANVGLGRRLKKTVTRVNSGFAPNANRMVLLQNYASNIVSDAVPVPPPYKTRRARTPSPDGSSAAWSMDVAPPRPIRRSSSMHRLVGKINANITQPQKPAEHYACWRVGIASLAIGPKGAPEFLRHRRGQMQLRKMAAVLKESNASAGRYRALDARDNRVKRLMDSRNEHEKKKKTGKKWYLVAARVMSRDPGKTGMVTVEKALVILVRR